MYILVVHHWENQYDIAVSWAEGPYTEEDAVTRRAYLWDSVTGDERMSIEMIHYWEAADR